MLKMFICLMVTVRLPQSLILLMLLSAIIIELCKRLQNIGYFTNHSKVEFYGYGTGRPLYYTFPNVNK